MKQETKVKKYKMSDGKPVYLTDITIVSVSMLNSGKLGIKGVVNKLNSKGDK